jgi:hypothetical protein
MEQMKNLIGISGKIGSGKDTVAAIIQELYPQYEVKKFAGKLKDIASILTGIPVEKFEDQEFKKEYLGEEWNYYTISLLLNGELIQQSGRFATREEAEKAMEVAKEAFKAIPVKYVVGQQQMTVRQLLQELGTNAMRNTLHENVWVNALMADYNKDSNWIVTDCRFPNEAKIIQEKDGILLRVERSTCNLGTHPSETALDNFPFEHVIFNNGSMDDLRNEVKKFLESIS